MKICHILSAFDSNNELISYWKTEFQWENNSLLLNSGCNFEINFHKWMNSNACLQRPVNITPFSRQIVINSCVKLTSAGTDLIPFYVWHKSGVFSNCKSVFQLFIPVFIRQSSAFVSNWKVDELKSVHEQVNFHKKMNYLCLVTMSGQSQTCALLTNLCVCTDFDRTLINLIPSVHNSIDLCTDGFRVHPLFKI